MPKKKKPAEEIRVDPHRGIDLSSLRELPKVTFASGEWEQILKQRKPVAVKKLTLHKKKDDPTWLWDDDFLVKHCSRESLFTCHSSESGCMLIDSAHVSSDAPSPYAESWERVSRRIRLTASQFQRIKCFPDRKQKYYMQEVLRTGLGGALEDRIAEFVYDSLDEVRRAAEFGAVSSQEICIFEPGCYKPAKYEEQDTIHVQLHGSRRVVVFAPAAYPCLYPYPVLHPADKHTQLGEHIENGTHPGPRYAKYPWAARHAFVVDLHPNEALFLPQYYWLHELAPAEPCTSTLLMCRSTKNEKEATGGQTVLTESSLIACRRNIEKLMAEKTGAPLAHALWICLERGKVPRRFDLVVLNTCIIELQKMLCLLVGQSRARLMLKEIAESRFSHLQVDKKEVNEILRESVDEDTNPPLQIASKF